jgi:hypothetical protein
MPSKKYRSHNLNYNLNTNIPPININIFSNQYINNTNIEENMSNFLRNILPTLPKNRVDYQSKKSSNFLLTFHGGVDEVSEFTIPKNFYIISLEKGGIMRFSFIINYLFLRIGLLNNLSKDFFTNIGNELLHIEKKLLKNKNVNIEHKKFKVYKPGSKFCNYKISTE